MNMTKTEAEEEIKRLEYRIEELKKVVSIQDIFSATSYSEICRRLGEKEILNDFHFLHKDDREVVWNRARMAQIERYLNEGWIPDFSNSDEPKYYCWYEYKKGSLVFAYAASRCFRFLGEVAFFKTKEIAEFVAKHFSDILIGCTKMRK